MILLSKIKNFVKSEKGDGISIVVYGTIVMMVFIFTAINFLNAKIIEEKFNSLKDTVESAAAGSVVHIRTSQDEGTVKKGTSATEINYDVYLQLALGYLINYDNIGDTALQGGTTNNYIRIDHEKAIESTLQLISKSVLGATKETLINNPNYTILMFFIEPSYDKNYKRSYDVIVYRTDKDGMVNGAGEYVGNYLGQCTNLETLQSNIQTEVNRKYVPGQGDSWTTDETKYKINLGATNTAGDTIRELGDYPYYLIVVKDFKLPSLLSNDTSKGSNILVMSDGKLKKPIATLQAGKVERKVFDNIVTEEPEREEIGHTHIYSEATCVVGGICFECGASGQALGHDFSGARTCNGNGTDTIKCIRCSATEVKDCIHNYNNAPNIPTITVAIKTPISLTFNISGTDPDNDTLTYDVYLGGIKKGSTTSSSYTVTSLTHGTKYEYYVVAKDPSGETTTSAINNTYTNCNGTGNVCNTSECDGVCDSCAGTGEITSSEFVTCSRCNGTGEVPCSGTIEYVYDSDWACGSCDAKFSVSCYKCTVCSAWYESCGSCGYTYGESEHETEYCSTCDGSGEVREIVDSQLCDCMYGECIHGETTSHKYCTHYTITTLTSHTYCRHGNTEEHECTW